MKIKLITNVPVDTKHKMTKDRILDVLEKSTGRGKNGYWVQGTGEKVLIMYHECKVIEDEN